MNSLEITKEFNLEMMFFLEQMKNNIKKAYKISIIITKQVISSTTIFVKQCFI